MYVQIAISFFQLFSSVIGLSPVLSFSFHLKKKIGNVVKTAYTSKMILCSDCIFVEPELRKGGYLDILVEGGSFKH